MHFSIATSRPKLAPKNWLLQFLSSSSNLGKKNLRKNFKLGKNNEHRGKFALKIYEKNLSFSVTWKQFWERVFHWFGLSLNERTIRIKGFFLSNVELVDICSFEKLTLMKNKTSKNFFLTWINRIEISSIKANIDMIAFI